MLWQAAASARLFSAVFGALLYKLVFWSDCVVSFGTVLAVFLLAACSTVLFTADLESARDAAHTGAEATVRYWMQCVAVTKDYLTAYLENTPSDL